MSDRRTGGTLAAVVFVLLTVATLGAFFVAQRLKNTPTAVQAFRARTVFSPNGDGRADDVRISFGLKQDDAIDVEIVDERGDVVRRLADDTSVRGYRRITPLVWDGRDDDGRRLPDGVYRVRITLRDQGRTLTVPSAITLDATPPRPLVVGIDPEPTVPSPALLPRPGGRPVTVRFRAPGRAPTVLLFRTDGPRPVRVLREVLPDGVRRWRWDGRLGDHGAPAGTYLVAIQSTDRAGNVGTTPRLDAAGRPAEVYGQPFPGRGGITVRYLAAQPPAGPVVAGSRGVFGVDARRHHYRWDLRVAGGRTLRTGTSRRAILGVTARGTDAALQILALRTRRHAAQSPMAVTSRDTHRVLVVLPAITWQGRNPVDDDGDGRPNTLDAGLPVRLSRVYAGGGLPFGLRGQEAPLLIALDRAGRRYDLTTDIALTARTGPPLDGHRGVLIAGDARWLPASLARRLRAFARAGGNVAVFGEGGLQRYVTITTRGGVPQARRPTQPTPDDLFGARPGARLPAPTALTADVDTVGLFDGTAGQFGPFAGLRVYEPPPSVGDGAAVATAVDPQGRAVVLATRVGRGVVARFPIPGMAARLSSDPELQRLLRNTWVLLSR